MIKSFLVETLIVELDFVIENLIQYIEESQYANLEMSYCDFELYLFSVRN